MQMKKIIGILLAMCFVLSMTAAAASANQDGGRGHNDGPGDHHKPKFDDGPGDHHKPKFDHHKPKFDGHKKHHHPAHWEKQRVYHNHFDKNCGCYKTGYVYKIVYVAEYWSYD